MPKFLIQHGKEALPQTVWLPTLVLFCILSVVSTMILLLGDLLHLSHALEITLEGSLLTLALLPIIYYLMLRPLYAQNHALQEAEAAERASEQKYRLIVEQMPVIVYTAALDDASSTLYISQGIERLLGYSAAEMIGSPGLWEEALHREDRDATLAALQQAIKAREIFHARYRMFSRAGEILWFEDIATVVYDAHGTALYLQGVMIDITAQVSASEALHASEARFRTMAETSIDAIFMTDHAGYLTYLSPSAEQISGQPIAQALGRHFSEFLPPADTPRVLTMLERALAGEIVMLEEFRTARADGTPLIIEINAAAVQRDGIVNGIQGVVRDITRRKQAEEQFTLAQAVIDSSIEGVTITDPDGTIVFTNPAFTTITGYSAQEALGHTPRILKSKHHTDDFYREMWASLVTQGYWQGEIWNRRKNGEAYPEWLTISAVRDPHGVTTHYVAVFHDITEAKAQEERIRYQAQHDALTGLPNRTLFLDRLTQAIVHAQRNHGQLAVMLLDLDRFKSVNDSLGHVVGDRLLQAVAERLRGCIRAEDTVARLGGDEFILLLPNLSDQANALLLADKIRQAFQHAIHIDGHELYVTPSIGITTFPDDGQDAGVLIQNADVALYRAKEEGRNAYRLYTPAMNDRALERLEMDAHLRKALEREEFFLVYQPRVELSTGRITSVEALIRWQHPELGLVNPGQFIPLAEETGLIVPIGSWVLREACRQGCAWQQAGLPPVRIAVNVSGRQFAQKDLVAEVLTTLTETGLAPTLLELEITESVAMADVTATLATLTALHDHGIAIAIDDFGTSYSSLGYLKQFPVHALKIDQSFVREIPDDRNSVAIAAAIVALAHSLGLQVIAEGAETEAQLGVLHTYQCEEVQGFVFSRPLPPHELVATFGGANGCLCAKRPVA
jgi:diguanylate cyclase (GGDEF)-like protein/PAS domain S-box-containing protein